jgi:protein SCO1
VEGAERRGPRKTSWKSIAAPMLVLLILVAGLSFAVFRQSNRAALPGGVQQSAPGDGYDGTLTLPAKLAPKIDLRNYLGQPVTLSQYRGRAVLLTFLYTNCPDICPLITSNLRVVQKELGAQAGRAQIIAVSVDPRGDTPAAVARFLHVHGMTGRMQYLIGSAPELEQTWTAWGVGSRREVGQPDLVAHSALVYGITASGTLKTVYPATFAPSQIVHDVPKLASG